MGADGHYLLMKRQTFHEKFPDVKPEDLGIYPTVVLGVEAYGAYHDTNGIDFSEYAKTGLATRADHCRGRIKIVQEEGANGIYKREARGMYSPAVFIDERDERAELARIEADPDYAIERRNLEALRWFLGAAEDHTVWT